MKRFVFAVAAIGALLVPVSAQAATFVVRDDYAASASERVNGGLYVVSGSTSVGAQVDGDLVAVGGTTSVTGRINGDLAALGGSLEVLGPVAGDVRAAGGSLSINSRVSGDVVVAGGQVRLLDGAVIDGDLYVAGGSVVVGGTVRGSVHAVAGRLAVNGTVDGDVQARSNEVSIGASARIGGILSYRSPSEAVIDASARIGSVSYTPMRSERSGRSAVVAVLAVLTAMKTLAYLGAAALIVWRWRREATEVLQDALTGWWSSVGRGLVYAILVPLAGVLLLVSFVGTFAGVGLLMAYGLVMLTANVLAGILLGAGVTMLIRRRSVLHVTWSSALLGTLAMQFIGFIPLVGWILQCLIFLAVFGVLSVRAQRRIS